MKLANDAKHLFFALLNGSMTAVCDYLDKKTDNATKEIGLTPFITSICGNLGTDHFKEMFNLKRMEGYLRSDDPKKLNHDLEQVFKAAAITAVGYVKKLLEADIKAELLNDDTIDKTLLRIELDKYVSYLDQQKKWLLDNPDVLKPDPADVHNSQNYQEKLTQAIMFFSGGFSDAQKATIRNAYARYLPQCMQLAFHEALKDDKNLKAFKAYQIKFMEESMALAKNNAADLAAIKAELQNLQLAHEGITVETVTTLFEQHKKEVVAELLPYFVNIDSKFDELFGIIIDTNQRVIKLESYLVDSNIDIHQIKAEINEINSKLQPKERSDEDNNLIIQLTKKLIASEEENDKKTVEIKNLKNALKALELTRSHTLVNQVNEAYNEGKYDTAVELFNKTKQGHAPTYFASGFANKLALKYEDAYEDFLKAVELEPNNEDYLYECSELAITLGKYEQAKEQLGKLIVLHKIDNERKASYYNNLGLVYHKMAQFKEAKNYYIRALEIDQKYYGESHPNIAIRYNNLGTLYKNLADYNEAYNNFKKAYVINVIFYTENHPEVALSHNNFGLLFRTIQQYDLAIEAYSKALKIEKALYGLLHPKIATRYNNLGTAYNYKGNYDKAIDYYNQALSIDKHFFDEAHPEMAIAYSNLGFAHQGKGEYDKAIDYYEKALAIDNQIFEVPHPNIAIRYNGLGVAYNSKGEYSKAIEYYEKALSILLQFFEPNHPNVITTQQNLEIAKKAKG